MSTKHLFNSADGLVLKSLRGAVALSPSLKLHSASKSVYVAHDLSPPAKEGNPRATVAVISGGGAGHEPAHAGYTGRGMLSASVSGDIFASPSAKQILQTIYLASSSGASIVETDLADVYKDVLVIINNYTGDRLNFGLAIEKALASSRIKIESVVVADDVSLLRPASDSDAQARRSLVGARGLAGNILVCKVLGAFAERGESLARVKRLGDAVVYNLASIGVGLEHCHVPGRGSGVSDAMRMADDECEIGLGLHNEPGVTRKKMEGSEKLVQEMLSLIMRSKEGSGAPFLQFQGLNGNLEADEVVLFVNNLGGMSQLEMNAVLDEILEQLAAISIYPVRVCSSAYMTSLNAPGFSISILNLSGVNRVLQASPGWDIAVNIPDLLDDPTDAAGWVGVRSQPSKKSTRDLELHLQGAGATSSSPAIQGSGNVSYNVERAIRSACESVLRQEEAITEFDTVLGDGDCGETFAAGAKAILAYLDSTESRAPPGTTRIWSAMNTDRIDHFYSTNDTEVKFLIDFYGFSLEGPKGTTTGYIYTEEQADTVPLFRLYSIGLIDHFYTTSALERDHSVKRLGYHVEGTLGYVYTSSGPGLVPLYRLHNAPAHDHYYTTSEQEREDASRNGWTQEEVVGYIYPLEEDAPVLEITPKS
ncbi:hypothetical protein D9615_004977 [Tricholomella constricta]|uniref:DhaK domain-containing protein n=1 Tax=Tricholomella constricta TaxID=117010 RepID=A0A8H5HH73_9AGAR|nr:hypothetical protein D9615_004977 [Tricholomella constricta]